MNSSRGHQMAGVGAKPVAILQAGFAPGAPKEVALANAAAAVINPP
jgi:hypothetical protein